MPFKFERVLKDPYYPIKLVKCNDHCPYGSLSYCFCDLKELDKVEAKHKSTKISFIKKRRNKHIRYTYKYYLESTDFYQGSLGHYMYDVYYILKKVIQHAASRFIKKNNKSDPVITIGLAYSLYDKKTNKITQELRGDLVLEPHSFQKVHLPEYGPYVIRYLRDLIKAGDFHHLYFIVFIIYK